MKELLECVRRAPSDPRAYAGVGSLVVTLLLAAICLTRSVPPQAYAVERGDQGYSPLRQPAAAPAPETAGPEMGRRGDAVSDALRPRDPARSLVRLKGYLHGLEEENASLRDKNDLMDKLISAKDAELTELKKDNSDLQQNLNHLLETHVALKGQFQQNAEKLKSQINEKNDEISNLNVMKYIRVTMQTQLNDLNAKVLELTNQKGALETELIGVKQEKAGVEQKLEDSVNEAKKQSELNAALNSTIVNMKDELAKRDGELSTYKTPDRDMELQNIRLKGETEEYRKQIESLTKRLEDVDSSKGDTEKSVYELSALVAKKELEKHLDAREKDKAIAKLQEDYNRILRENESLKIQLEARTRAKR